MVGVSEGLGGGTEVRVEVGVELLSGVGVFVRSGVAVCVPGVRVPDVVVGGGVGVPIGGIVGVSGGVRSGVGTGVSVGGKLIVGDGDRVRVRVGVVVVVGVCVCVGVCVTVPVCEREGEGHGGSCASAPGPVAQGASGLGSSARASRAVGRLARRRKIERIPAIRVASPTAALRRDTDPSPMDFPSASFAASGGLQG